MSFKVESYSGKNLLQNKLFLKEESPSRKNISQEYSIRHTYTYIHTYLAQTPEIGQGLERILSCGARKPKKS